MQVDGALFAQLIELLREVCPAQGVVLDVGCGCAFVRKDIAALGLEYASVFLADCDEVDLRKAEALAEGKTVAALVALHTLENCEKVTDLLSALRAFAARHSAPLIVCAPNAAQIDRVFSLLLGGGGFDADLHSFTADSLRMRMGECGFYEIARKDVAAVTGRDAPLEGSLIRRHVTAVFTAANPYAATQTFLRAYLPGCKTAPDKGTRAEEAQKPFLSVVTRTQGLRMEALRETLLCLSAQINQDFEVLVIGHRLDDIQKAHVADAIAETPAWLRGKIRLLSVGDGGRSAPLNAGFSQAKGRYVAVLDDDDIVFDDWVERFYRLSIARPGAVLHAYAVSQEWETVETQRGKGLRARGAPSGGYCADYDPLEQLHRNNCPVSSLAFPAFLHRELGLRFDERYNTTEDWDYLLRAVAVCGVADVRAVTFLYRLWADGGNSKAAHTDAEWRGNYAAIQSELDRAPLLLPPGSVSRIDSWYKRHSNEEDKGAEEAVLYLGDGEGYSEERTLRVVPETQENGFSCEYKGLDSYEVTSLRFDPREDGGFALSDFAAAIALSDGSEHVLRAEQVLCSGQLIDGQLVFLRSDPQIELPLPQAGEARVASLRVSFVIRRDLFSPATSGVLERAYASLASSKHAL